MRELLPTYQARSHALGWASAGEQELAQRPSQLTWGRRMVCTSLIGYLGTAVKVCPERPYESCSKFPAPTFPPLTALGLGALRFILTLGKKKKVWCCPCSSIP